MPEDPEYLSDSELHKLRMQDVPQGRISQQQTPAPKQVAAPKEDPGFLGRWAESYYKNTVEPWWNSAVGALDAIRQAPGGRVDPETPGGRFIQGITDAAWDKVPFFGPMYKGIKQAYQKEGGMGATTTALGNVAQMATVPEAPEMIESGVRAGTRAAKSVAPIVKEAAVGGGRDVAATAAKVSTHHPLSLLKTDPAAASGVIPGIIAGHYSGIPHGTYYGAAAGAAVPSFVRGAYRAVKAGREARKAGPMRFEQFPETPPLPPTEFVEFPQPPPITPEPPMTYEQFPQYRSEELPPTQFENLNPESTVPDLRAQQLTDALKRVAERKKKSQ